MARITRDQGRRAFGGNPAGYDEGRPDYPAALIPYLKRTCGLKAGIRAFEVGPGPGRFTERVSGQKLKQLLAIEPDPRLAAYTAKRIARVKGASVVCSPFEDVALDAKSFDLGMAATSFHWVQTGKGLSKVYEALRPGGSWAMWWNVYADSKAKDPFLKASDSLFKTIPRTPSHRKGRRQGYPTQVSLRKKELKRAGFVGIKHHVIRWKQTFTSEQMVALVSTFSPVLLLPEVKRKAFLTKVRALVDQLGGQVGRSFMTSIYTARRPQGRN